MDRTHGRLLVLQSVLALANSMAAVFALIFFLDRAFAPGDVVALNVIAFATSTAGCVAITRIRPVSARALMLAGMAALLASYAAFLVLSGWPLLLFVAVAWGVYIPFFFLAFNGLVIGITRAEDRAAKIGSFILAVTLVSILGPSLGGAIVEAFGYPVLFSSACIVLAVDAAFLWRLTEARRPIRFAFGFRALGARTSAALFAEGGFEGLWFAVLPLLAYGFAARGLTLGSLFSLFALAGGVVTVVLGTLSDRLRNRRPFLLVGAAASALAVLLVVRATTLAEFALGNSLLSLTASLAPLFLFAIAVERSPADPAVAIATREVLLNAGRAASLAGFAVLGALGVPGEQAFLLAAISLSFVALGEPGSTPGAARYSR